MKQEIQIQLNKLSSLNPVICTSLRIPLLFPKCPRLGFSPAATQAQPEGLTAVRRRHTAPRGAQRRACGPDAVCGGDRPPQVNLHTALESSGLMRGDVNRAEDNRPHTCRSPEHLRRDNNRFKHSHFPFTSGFRD